MLMDTIGAYLLICQKHYILTVSCLPRLPFTIICLSIIVKWMKYLFDINIKRQWVSISINIHQLCRLCGSTGFKKATQEPLKKSCDNPPIVSVVWACMIWKCCLVHTRSHCKEVVAILVGELSWEDLLWDATRYSKPPKQVEVSSKWPKGWSWIGW